MPNRFNEFLQTLNQRGRRIVKLLKEREITVNRDAQTLLNTIDDLDLAFLHRNLIRL